MNRTFNYYSGNIKDSEPKGSLTLEDLLISIKSPKQKTIELLNKIQEADKNSDDKLKAELKQLLYSFTPAVFCVNSRKYANIVNFTGTLVLDFDKFKNKEEAEFFKTQIYFMFDFIIATWLSASGRGVRALIDIPVVNSVEEYKQYFDGVKNYTELGNVRNFDIAPKNAILPLFISYDEHLLFNSNFKTFDKKYIEPVKVVKPLNIKIDYDSNHNIKAIIEKSLSNITNEGHPILRATSYALGGYVGAGYIGRQEAEMLIDYEIERHPYLSKKASIYKTTAKTMINKGINQPLYL